MAVARPSTDLFSAKTMLFGLRFMQDFGLKDFQAAGCFGNLGHESGGFRLLQEIKPTVKGSRGGYGWAQWTGPRRRLFEAWCAKKKLIPSTDEASYGFLCEELRTTQGEALASLRHATNLDHATDAFCRTFERPGVVNLPSRMTWARRALAAIDKGLAAHEAVAKAVVAKAAAPTPKPAAAPPVVKKAKRKPRAAAPKRKARRA